MCDTEYMILNITDIIVFWQDIICSLQLITKTDSTYG